MDELTSVATEAAVPWPATGFAIVAMSAANTMIEYFISNLTSQMQLSGPSCLEAPGVCENELAFLSSLLPSANPELQDAVRA